MTRSARPTPLRRRGAGLVAAAVLPLLLVGCGSRAESGFAPVQDGTQGANPARVSTPAPVQEAPITVQPPTGPGSGFSEEGSPTLQDQQGVSDGTVGSGVGDTPGVTGGPRGPEGEPVERADPDPDEAAEDPPAGVDGGQ